MSIRFSCRCGRKLKVSDEKIGMKVLCSSCGNTLKVPKKSQDVYWQDVEPKSQEAGTDYVGGVKEFLFQVTPGAIVVVLMVWGAYYLATQAIIGDSGRPELGEVSGTVTLNGEPLQYATVRFRPVDEKKEGRVAPSQGLTDERGTFRLFYVRDVPGAAVGEHIVEVEAKDPRGRERIPAIYNRTSNLHRSVKPGSQVIDIELEVREE